MATPALRRVGHVPHAGFTAANVGWAGRAASMIPQNSRSYILLPFVISLLPVAINVNSAPSVERRLYSTYP